MLFNTCTAACGLAIFSSLVSGATIPQYFEKHPFTRRGLPEATIQKELGSLLSKKAAIFGPQDPRFDEATLRYNAFAVPKVEIVAQPGVEADVATIVKYCNKNSIEFLTVNRAHGWTTTLNRFNGLEIDMALLQNITIQPGHKTAVFQGGAYDGEVIDYLWDRGYVTTTGSCACVGMLGPGLGGGHGRLEGLYGLISDNMVNLNVVLADGSTVQVNSKSYTDLFWGMRGAGHNFGIVTSFELNIYPRGPSTWHYHNYIWTGDKLETVFTALNKLHNNGSTPVGMSLEYGYININSTVSTTEPVLSWYFVYMGSAQDAEKLLAPFNKIDSVWDESGDLPYTQVPSIQGTGLDSPLCTDNNLGHIQATANLQVYNVTAQRQIYELYAEKLKTYPAFNTAFVTHEGYSNKAVHEHPSDDSAFPFRSDNLLMYALIPHLAP
ncbi:hypothetical protein ONZ43_g6922 [Nemania bipapillata]|uniref:Uncharacterized protein n=1 Tax=Nemania bipapillata TaxID=110536 RepID=A0ACC2HWG1_9PEZI|nr:hypothetical protein ONZ43_g6922 [Nemania bipapillata]